MEDREKLYNKIRTSRLYYFDIDGTITHETEGWEYEKRTPRIDVIDKMWVLIHKGARIVLWTARLEIDRVVTEKWLKEHNVPYSSLLMGKPFWDLYVCDKSVNIEQWVEDA